MKTIEIRVRRFTFVSPHPFGEVVRRLTEAVGHPDVDALHEAVVAAQTPAELANAVKGALGPSDLMEFARYDAGEVLRKERGDQQPGILRLVVGNPLVAKEMTRTVPDAAAYVPVTLLITERPDGVHLSYDSLANLVAPYGSQAAFEAARYLDEKLACLLETAAH